jgi:hypothetical protein
MSGKQMRSVKRGAGEQEKESAKEEKVEEVHTGDTNNGTSPQNPADNERVIPPTASPWSTDALAFPRHPAASSIVDVACTTARTATNGGVQGVSDDVMYLARSSFDWAEDVNATVTSTHIAFVTPAARAPRDFSVLRSNTRNPWGSLSRRHHRSQPRTCNPFYSCKYMTNQGYNPAAPPPPPAPIQLVETVRHPHRIAPTKPVIKAIGSSPTSIPPTHPTSSCEPISAVRSDSASWPSCAFSLDWSGDPLLAGLTRILEALGWTRGITARRGRRFVRGGHME